MVDSPPGFFLRLWLFLVKLACSFTRLFKSNVTYTTLPPPVTAAGNLTTSRRRTRKLVSFKLSNELTHSQRNTQKKRVANQPLQLPATTETHQGSPQLLPSNNCYGPNDLRTTSHTTGRINGTISPGYIPESGTVRTPTRSTFSQPSDLGRRDSFTSDIMTPDFLSGSVLSRRVSLGVVSICRSSTGSILSVSPVKYRLLGIPCSVGTRVSRSESVHSVSASIRRCLSGRSATMPHTTIYLESPWSPKDKSLPLDVWMNPKGILVNAHGPLRTVVSTQAEVTALQYGKGTSQERPISHAIGLDNCFPVGALVMATVSTPIEVDPSVITQVSILGDTQASAEDVKFENLVQEDTSSELEDRFSGLAYESSIDTASDDQIPDIAYIPSSNHEVRPLNFAAETSPRTDHAVKSFSVPYLSSVRQSNQDLLRSSSSSLSKSFSDVVECNTSRALADLIDLLDLTALQTETVGVSEIHMGDYLVRAG